MVVLDPPLALNDKPQVEFDSDTFKVYKQEGSFVDFVVWPALFLQETDDILERGVVQCCDTKPDCTKYDLQKDGNHLQKHSIVG